MTYFLTALYYEAEDIISHYKMKKVMESVKFQVFKGENEVLIISGTGYLKAIVAVTHVLDIFKHSEDDIFVNIGICGTSKAYDEGEVFLCNKLIDNFNKRSFYPDMLFRHPFKEATLESFSNVVHEKKQLEENVDIVDQEGAFVYEAASMVLQPHNIHIIKIVSDFLKPENVTVEKIKNIMKRSMPKIYDWLEFRNDIKIDSKEIISGQEQKILKGISENLHLTAAMKIKFEKLSKQYKVRNGQIVSAIKEYTEVKCKSKNEGKRVFGQIKNKLMEL